MPLDIKSLLRDSAGQNYALHDAHVNPAFAKTLRTIGFDRTYARAQGQYLWDDKGQRYLDMLSGYGVFSLGRNNADVKQSLIDFLGCDYPSLVQLDAPLLSGLLAGELKRRMPNRLDYVYFTSSGAEGVETAIKFARCATGRNGVVHAHKSFHGLTTGALAVNGDDTFKAGFPGLMTDVYTIPYNDLAALEDALTRHAVAAFIVEPIQGKGVNIPQPGYLREAASLCRKHKALFVADEVQTGLARTGKFLAFEHDGDVDPDIVILSKALSGGYVPVGAVLTRKWIFNKVFSSMERSVVHSSTFGQGSFAMVAGLATLACIDEQNLSQRAAHTGDLLGQRLRTLADDYEFIGDIRWRGLMLGIEFARPDSLALRCGWEVVHKLSKDLFPQAVTMPLLHDHHILTQTAGRNIDVIKLIPPLIISAADVDDFVTAFRRVMDDLHAFPGPIWESLSRIGKSVLGKPSANIKAGDVSYQ